MSEVRCIWISHDETHLPAADIVNLVQERYDVGISPRTMIDDYRFGDVKGVVMGVLATLGAPTHLITREAPRSTRGERRAARRAEEDAARRAG